MDIWSSEVDFGGSSELHLCHRDGGIWSRRLRNIEPNSIRICFEIDIAQLLYRIKCKSLNAASEKNIQEVTQKSLRFRLPKIGQHLSFRSWWGTVVIVFMRLVFGLFGPTR